MVKFQKIMAVTLAAAVAVSYVPALSAQASTKVSTKKYTISRKAGTYTSSIKVKLKAKKGYKLYYTTSTNFSTNKVIKSKKSKTLTIKKTTTLKVYAVKSGKKITSKKLKSSSVKNAARSYKYTIKAASTTPTTVPESDQTQTTPDNNGGGNNSSDNNSGSNAQTETYKYVLMNIPYSVFEKAEDGDSAGVVDAVSGATAKVRNAGVAGATYNGGGDVDETTPVNVTKGVQFPVRVSESVLKSGVYTEITDSSKYHVYYSGRGQATDTDLTGKDALIQADDYAYYTLSDTPAVYMELTSDGFSAAKGDVTQINDAGDIKYGTNWGTYEIDFATAPENAADSSAAAQYITGNVAAVQVVTDKKTFWLRPTDQIWRSIEIGWFAEDDLADTNGATLISYKVYTDTGIYNVPVNQKLKTLSDATVSAALTGSTGTVTGLPADLENAKVSVSYTEGTGRQAVTTQVVDKVELTDGAFTIPDDVTLENGKNYTVTVSSDNYIDISAAAAYSASAE